MLQYTFKKVAKTTQVLLASVMGITFFTAPFLSYATSEFKNNQAIDTLGHLSQQSKVTSQQTTQDCASQVNTQAATITKASNEQDSISITKYGRFFAKAVDLIGHAGLIGITTYALYDEPPKKIFHIVAKLSGLIGTSVLLTKSIKEDLKKPLPQSPDKKLTEECHAIKKDNRLSNTQTDKKLMLKSICGLLGIMGHGWILKEAWKNQKLVVALFATPNIGFLGHSLYDDYKSYMATENSTKTA